MHGRGRSGHVVGPATEDLSMNRRKCRRKGATMSIFKEKGDIQERGNYRDVTHNEGVGEGD